MQQSMASELRKLPGEISQPGNAIELVDAIDPHVV